MYLITSTFVYLGELVARHWMHALSSLMKDGR
jgi:hypothetical protein